MTYTDSPIYSVTTGSMEGILIFNPETPEAAMPFLYGNVGRTDALAVGVTNQPYLTQVKPEYSFSDNESETIGLAITVPFSETHDFEVGLLRMWVRARRVMGYKDNRSRLLYGVLTAVSISDVPHGTVVSGTLIVSEHL